MNILFRVDASENIGMGHLMRCLALSEELKKKGNKCYILSKILDDKVINKIKKFDIEFYKIKQDNDIIFFSKKNDIKWIITDSYNINKEYIKSLKNENFKVLSIDDNAIIHYFSDIVVNQNIGAEILKYSAEKYTKFLLGPKYAILRDELLRRSEKKNKESVEKILIMLGGTDSNNLTLKILKSLEKINKNYVFFVIVGLFNPFYEQLKDFSEKSKTNIKLLKSPENMAEIYLESDLAISAGGTSCYELSYFGIPNIILTIADNQINSAKAFDKKNVSIYLGHKSEISTKDIWKKIEELVNNKSIRKTMRNNGRKLVDGKGKKRIVELMESYN
jgi:UDP-2,4-diacetamido-2,4,6-trideoxy-beta-L-altropyranose hydrolase